MRTIVNGCLAAALVLLTACATDATDGEEEPVADDASYEALTSAIPECKGWVKQAACVGHDTAKITYRPRMMACGVRPAARSVSCHSCAHNLARCVPGAEHL
jgi:hypothetical protein